MSRYEDLGDALNLLVEYKRQFCQGGTLLVALPGQEEKFERINRAEGNLRLMMREVRYGTAEEPKNPPKPAKWQRETVYDRRIPLQPGTAEHGYPLGEVST